MRANWFSGLIGAAAPCGVALLMSTASSASAQEDCKTFDTERAEAFIDDGDGSTPGFFEWYTQGDGGDLTLTFTGWPAPYWPPNPFYINDWAGTSDNFLKLQGEGAEFQIIFDDLAGGYPRAVSIDMADLNTTGEAGTVTGYGPDGTFLGEYEITGSLESYRFEGEAIGRLVIVSGELGETVVDNVCAYR